MTREWRVEERVKTDSWEKTLEFAVVRSDGIVYAFSPDQAMAANVCSALNRNEQAIMSATSDDEYLLCLRQNMIDVADALKAENIEECRQALRSIALGLIPESRLADFGAIVCKEHKQKEVWVENAWRKKALQIPD
jgi:hypothetical protein